MRRSSDRPVISMTHLTNYCSDYVSWRFKCASNQLRRFATWQMRQERNVRAQNQNCRLNGGTFGCDLERSKTSAFREPEFPPRSNRAIWVGDGTVKLRPYPIRISSAKPSGQNSAVGNSSRRTLIDRGSMSELAPAPAHGDLVAATRLGVLGPLPVNSRRAMLRQLNGTSDLI